MSVRRLIPILVIAAAAMAGPAPSASADPLVILPPSGDSGPRYVWRAARQILKDMLEWP